jgi:enamine deaminase RidA (YjgF/YER057c/UK114 family)
MTVESKLQRLGLDLPPPIQAPAGVHVPFAWARTYGDRVYLSGHGPLTSDGSVAGPLGRVGAEVSPEAAHATARAATLAMLASLKGEIGALDHVAAWLAVSGMVNVAPGFTGTTNVINGCSDLLLELFDPEVGRHARTAIGMAPLPLDMAVVIGAEVAVRL